MRVQITLNKKIMILNHLKQTNYSDKSLNHVEQKDDDLNHLKQI